MTKQLTSVLRKSPKPDAHASRQGALYASGDLAHMENPLETFQKFDLTGHGLKGQTTSGFSQSGLGLRISVGGDLGTFICPWLVRIPIDISASGQRADHAELVLTRFPRRIYRQRLNSVDELRAWRHRPTWSTSMPLVLSSMRGIRWEGSLGARAGAQLGVGNVLGRDQVRFALNAQAEISASGTISTTNLQDICPLRFRSAYPADTTRDGQRAGARREHRVADDWSNNMAAYIDAELLGDVKRRIVLWIEHKIGHEIAAATIRAGRWATERTSELLDEWAATQHHDPAWDLDPTGGLKALMGKLRAKPSTVELLGALVDLENALDQAVTADANGNALSDDDKAQKARLMETDRQMIRQLQDTVRARQLGKRAGESNLVERRHPDPIEPTLSGAISLLRIGSRSFTGNAGAGIAATVIIGASARFTAEYVGKDVSIRHQSVSRRALRSAMVFTQDTVIRQRMYTIDASAEAHLLSSGKPVSAGSVFGTVRYTSACAYWHDGYNDGGEALANGSGVSFGISVEADRLYDYAIACRNKVQSGFTTAALNTESMLADALQVTTFQLRDFLAVGPVDLLGDIAIADALVDTSVIVESAFAIRRPARFAFPHGQTRSEPGELFEMPWVAERLAATPPATPSTDLNVLRIRYRKRRLIDSTRPLLSFGWAFSTGPSTFTPQGLVTPFQTFSTPVGVGGGPTRVERVGAEGIIDLHSHFFPKEPADADRAEAYELSVPGVALFSQ